MGAHNGRARACHRRAWFRQALNFGWVLMLATTVAQAQPRALTVAVDASLARPMAAVARSFEAAHPGVAVKLVPGAPGTLLDQLASGADFDLLAGSDAQTAASGVQRRLLVPELNSAFAGNTLVLVVPARSKLPVQRLADLGRPEVLRIAMGQQAVEPAGRYAREAINAQRLWPSLQSKIVLAGDEPAALALVAAAAVEAGFVYASSAAAAPAGQLRVVETLATATPVRYLAHVGVASQQKPLAADFLRHLRGEAAQAEFQRLGFGLP